MVENWITSLIRDEIYAGTDYIQTDNNVPKTYLFQTNASSTYATIAIPDSLQTEITGIQGEVKALQKRIS